jgi:transposase
MRDAAEALARKHGTTWEEIESVRARLLSRDLPESRQPRAGLMLTLLQELILETAELRIQLGRTRGLLFGPRTEKKREKDCEPSGAPLEAAEASASSSEPSVPPPGKGPAPGHGRLPAEAYSGARLCTCGHPRHSPGDRCPRCGGTLRAQKPSVEIRITGAPPLTAVRYELERLRCDTCGWVTTAPTPPEAPLGKYDSGAVSMMGLTKYGLGLPFYRMARLQEALGVPVPESTQYERVRDAAQAFRPVLDRLRRLAADAELVFVDDTRMKILNVERGDRKSTQTTAVVARRGAHWIHLYETGTRHAGDNLKRLFASRSPGLPPPIQMSDALACNTSHGIVSLIAFCLMHARRKFFEIQGYFPDVCAPLLENIGRIYHWEREWKDLDPRVRLERHRRRSLPLMERIRDSLKAGLEARRIEPNGSLGKAAAYFLNHWDGLTGFCRIPGAPLDNGASERALKAAILNRKNAYFFKTHRGARVGDGWMSLIKTAGSAGLNPFEYLTLLQENAPDVASRPEDFLPWKVPRPRPGSMTRAPRAEVSRDPPA